MVREHGDGAGRRAARGGRAQAHIEDMEHRFAAEIEASASAVHRIDGMPPAPAACVPEGDALSTPVVHVVDGDATSVIVEHGRGRARFCDMAVLDCASFTHPAGGYERGFWGQEEALCADSYLCNILKRQADWYAENRRRNINCNLYRNRALLVPHVRFAREKVHAYADVIVAAAPHARRARDEYKVDADVLARAMRERIRFVLSIADELGHDKLVLGAFGCDSNGWDAGEVAEMLREELASGSHAAHEVYLAIPRTRHQETYERFEHAFAAFPKVNTESYEDLRARHEAKAAAEAQAAQDEDEDDWHKYL